MSWLIWQFLFWDKQKGLIVRTSPKSTTSSHELRVARGPPLHDLCTRVARLYRGLLIIIHVHGELFAYLVLPVGHGVVKRFVDTRHFKTSIKRNNSLKKKRDFLCQQNTLYNT